MRSHSREAQALGYLRDFTLCDCMQLSSHSMGELWCPLLTLGWRGSYFNWESGHVCWYCEDSTIYQPWIHHGLLSCWRGLEAQECRRAGIPEAHELSSFPEWISQLDRYLPYSLGQIHLNCVSYA